ncbi:Amidase [Geodia barretti]|uniref:Amidase n=1 Tax=Geodia barretti TaxID=519541 RepID=A0AA35RHS6_GEOBA|nr:Amidase [Geodia barretti]
MILARDSWKNSLPGPRHNASLARCISGAPGCTSGRFPSGGGGGAANVAAGVTFASLGTDLGGSVRLPGAFCGVVGLKQTFGRVSQRGLLVTSFNGDHIGPMTRSVRDSALVLQAIAGYDPLDPSTVPVPVDDYALLADSVVTHEPLIASNREDYSPDTLYRTLAGQFVLGRDYSKALKVQRIIKEEHARVLQEVDFLVTPTTPLPAPRIDADTIMIGGERQKVRGPGSGLISRNTSPMNATGFPAITVPCGFSDVGLPID